MKRYYRVMLGKNSMHAEQCAQENFIGADYGIQENLTGKLPDDWREFNRKYIPIFLKGHPDKTRVGAGLPVVHYGLFVGGCWMAISCSVLMGLSGTAQAKSLVLINMHPEVFCPTAGLFAG